MPKTLLLKKKKLENPLIVTTLSFYVSSVQAGNRVDIFGLEDDGIFFNILSPAK